MAFFRCFIVGRTKNASLITFTRYSDVRSNDAQMWVCILVYFSKYTKKHMLTGPDSLVVNDRAEESIQVL